MFNFGLGQKQKDNPENVVVLDFGSQSAKAAILDLSGFRPVLLGLGEEFYKEGTILSGLVSDLDDFLATVRNSIRRSSSACGFTPNHLVFSLSGEFVKTFSVDLKIHRAVEGLLAGPEEDRVLKEINRLIFREVELEFQRVTGNPRPDFKIIEKRIINLETLSQVSLENLSAVREKDFVATVLISFLSSQTENLLAKVAADLKRRVLFKTSQTSNLVTLLKKSWGGFSAVLVDFGGQVTDVCLVLAGRIVGTRTIPLGGRDLTAELSLRLNISLTEAEQRKVSGDFSFEEAKDFLSFWRQSLDLSLGDISENKSLPSLPYYLFGRSSFIAFLRDGSLGPSFKEVDQKIIKDALNVGDEKIDGFEPLLSTGAQVLENYVSSQF